MDEIKNTAPVEQTEIKLPPFPFRQQALDCDTQGCPSDSWICEGRECSACWHDYFETEANNQLKPYLDEIKRLKEIMLDDNEFLIANKAMVLSFRAEYPVVREKLRLQTGNAIKDNRLAFAVEKAVKKAREDTAREIIQLITDLDGSCAAFKKKWKLDIGEMTCVQDILKARYLEGGK